MNELTHNISLVDHQQNSKIHQKQSAQTNNSSFKKPISYPVKSVDQQSKQKYLKHLETIQKSIKKIMNNRQASLQSSIYTTKQIQKFNKSRRNKRGSKQMSSSFLVKSITLTQKTTQNFNKEKQNLVNCGQNRSSKSINYRKSLQLSKKFSDNNLTLQNTKINQNTQKLQIKTISIQPKKPKQPKQQDQPDKKLEYEYTIHKKIELKLKKYRQQQKYLTKLHNIVPIHVHSDRKLRAYVGNGNNSGLVKQLLRHRWWWEVCQERKQVQFIWSQLKDREYFGYCQKREGFLHNHFLKNQYLGNKKTLFYLMKDYYRSLNKQVFDYLPVTFHILNSKDHQWPKFLKYYNHQHQKNKSIQQNKKQKLLWIIKPGQNSNRGNGIKICQKIQQIQQIITQTQKLTHQQRKKQSFIVQKYISKPFLYNRRKFDIRCYMFLVKIGKSVKGYWCKESYIRTSGRYFDLTNYSDSFIHLTNDAIQTHSADYGHHEQGNKLSIGTFQKYLDANFPFKYNYNTQIYPKLKSMAQDSIKAAIYSIGMDHTSPVFELFGLDFMLDQNFKPWLIEINTNPCLQTSCSVLKSIIPRVLDDCFKLSIDICYPPPEYSTLGVGNKGHLIPDVQHLFQLIFDSDQYCKLKEQERA